MAQTPNFKTGVGILATKRDDFQKHIDGTAFNHSAPALLLNPTIIVDGSPTNTVQEALAAINVLASEVIPDASASVKGLIQLAGDLGPGLSGAADPKVTGLRGFPIQNATPTTGDLLTWSGTAWTPTALGTSFPSLTVGDLTVNNTLTVNTPNHITIAATGGNHDISITSGRDIDLTAFDDIHLTTSGGSNADIIVIASRNATFRSNTGTTTVTSIGGTTEITSSGGGVNITAPTSNISISAPGSGIISINGGYSLNIDSGSGGVAINTGDFSVYGGNVLLSNSVTLGTSSLYSCTVKSVMKFTSTGRIQWQGILLNNANQSINILQYKYLVIPSGTGPSIHTYTLTDSSGTSNNGDWFQIYNASSINHNIAGVVAFSIGIGATRNYVKISGVWTQVSSF